MTDQRRVIEQWPSVVTEEGAGVLLRRAFGRDQVPRLDPFLMLDDFHSSDPANYTLGFPWHPHRGMETVTYLLEGSAEHGDSMKNRGTIGAGDVQWMTAGRGIVHQELPQRADGRLWGFQLWVNLPTAHKMMDPRYRDVLAATIPRVETGGGAVVAVIAGRFAGTVGPVREIVRSPSLFDVTVAADGEFHWEAPAGLRVFAYVIAGRGTLGGEETESERLVLFADEGAVVGRAGASGLRFLLGAGQPLGEPVAWRGPIVMNTNEELDVAFAEYRKGTFLRPRP